ncbi:MAG: hypothetical protein N3H31_05650 [Candidatus Nezhaarchaeota archaeon]|nr:hypothetical protein [Candidatus Nezhaarchaeota archaeon]
MGLRYTARLISILMLTAPKATYSPAQASYYGLNEAPKPGALKALVSSGSIPLKPMLV